MQARQLRAYMVTLQGERTKVSVHRDLEAVVTEHLLDRERDGSLSAVFHIGFDRPDSSALEIVLAAHPGRVLITEPARWTLPETLRCSRWSVGAVEISDALPPMPLYLALAGWGYEENDRSADAASTPTLQCASPEALVGWLSALAEAQPTLLAHLLGHEVKNDYDYLQVRGNLPVAIRDEIDDFRFRKLLPEVDFADPLNFGRVFRILPEWLLSLPVEELVDLSVRARNGLLRSHISAVWQIAELGDQIWNLANIGQKSISNISESLLATIEKDPRRFADWDRTTAAPLDAIASLPPALQQQTALPSVGRHSQPVTFTSLWLAVQSSIADLNPRDRIVAEERFGWAGAPRTLEEIGAKLGVTRERARQIESRVLRRFRSKTWPREMKSRLDALYVGRDEPLYLDLLAAEDQWFEGFEGHFPVLTELIQTVADTGYKVWPLAGRPIVTQISSSEWDGLIRSARTAIEQQVSARLSPAEARLFLDSIASSYGCEDLASELRDAMVEQLHFVRDNETNGEYLAGVGRSVRAAVAAIMEQAEGPLTIADIRDQCAERLDETPSDNALRNALQHIGAFPFSGRRYGFERHLQLSDEVVLDVLAELENILASGPAERQWHCAELAEILLEQRPDLPDHIDSFGTNVILHRSDRANYLGRLVWTCSSSSRTSSNDRIEIAELTLTILARAGRPMTGAELCDEIKKIRGLNSTALFAPSDLMARVGPGAWGLVDRDFALDTAGRSDLLDALHEVLSRRSRGLHVSELRSALDKVGRSVPEEVTDYMIFGLTQVDQRFQIGRGQIVGLAGWDDLGRYTLRAAIHRTIEELQHVAEVDCVYYRVSQLLERPIDHYAVNAEMKQFGFELDETAETWIKQTEEDEGV
jgi:hypothetical protein